MNLFVKAIVVYCAYNLYVEFGGMFGISFPSGTRIAGATKRCVLVLLFAVRHVWHLFFDFF